MRVAVVGLGYVGTVTAAMLAEQGNRVIGVDIQPEKVESINAGRAPFYEPGLDEVLSGVVAMGDLTATTDPVWAVRESDVSLICVGTPPGAGGRADVSAVQRAVGQIATALEGGAGYHLVVLRSTFPPAALGGLLETLTDLSGRPLVGSDGLGFCTNPEFLREGTALEDFRHPPMTLIGELDTRAGDVLDALYSAADAPVFRTGCREALLVKYVSNAWHALKVSFANEMGCVAEGLGVDGDEVMRLFAKDFMLNISPAYLRPGFAYGGSCLPKDTEALLAMADAERLPVLAAIPQSNEWRIVEAVDRILSTGARRVVLVGLSFKRGTDDLRGSPFIAVAEELLDADVEVRIVDPDVPLSKGGDFRRWMVDENGLAGLPAWAECWAIGKRGIVPDELLAGACVVELG